MKYFKKTASLVCLVTILAASSSRAVPFLQLDIAGGTYDPVTETIIASGNSFTLYALMDPSSSRYVSGAPFYISAAILPVTSATSFGSFKVDGTTYSGATGGNMQYGTPPVDYVFPDLPSHGVFPTEYAQIGFSFNSANKATSYDTALNPGGFTASSSGTLLYQAFTVDITGLVAGDIVHFDLYDETVKLGKPSARYGEDNAPFSHDAQSGSSTGSGGGTPGVPDGGATVALLGAAMIGLGALRRKLSQS